MFGFEVDLLSCFLPGRTSSKHSIRALSGWNCASKMEIFLEKIENKFIKMLVELGNFTSKLSQKRYDRIFLCIVFYVFLNVNFMPEKEKVWGFQIITETHILKVNVTSKFDF